MTGHVLVPHPDTPSNALKTVRVEIARADEGTLVIRYVAEGDIGRICVPTPVKYASRHDGLWQTTCFEAFLAADLPGPYVELNFAPSTGWAAYRFISYRDGRSDLAVPPPHFDVDLLPSRLEITVAVDVTALGDLPTSNSWHCNLSAVIEERDGTKSYWALRHPPGDKPDFHHPDCFALELPPASDA